MLTEELTGPDALDRIARLGLSVEVLKEAVVAGEFDFRRCSPLDPPTRPGFDRWATTVRVLREGHIPFGFGSTNSGGVPRIVHPTTGVAVTASSADGRTGLEGDPGPSTINSKGEATLKLVRANRQQLSLFAKNPPPDAPVAKAAATYVLLFYCAPGSSIIRSELSLPWFEDGGGRLVAWKERILLPEVEISDDIDSPLPGPETDPRIDIPVVAR